jgi:hypothetical protein
MGFELPRAVACLRVIDTLQGPYRQAQTDSPPWHLAFSKRPPEASQNWRQRINRADYGSSRSAQVLAIVEQQRLLHPLQRRPAQFGETPGTLKLVPAKFFHP